MANFSKILNVFRDKFSSFFSFLDFGTIQMLRSTVAFFCWSRGPRPKQPKALSHCNTDRMADEPSAWDTFSCVWRVGIFFYFEQFNI